MSMIRTVPGTSPVMARQGQAVEDVFLAVVPARHLLCHAKPAFFDYAVAGFAKECDAHQARGGQARYIADTVSWPVEVLADTTVRLPVFLFPMWTVAVDGQPVAVVRDPETGLIRVNLAAGAHDVRLTWVDPPLFVTARWISLASVALILLLALAGRARR